MQNKRSLGTYHQSKAMKVKKVFYLYCVCVCLRAREMEKERERKMFRPFMVCTENFCFQGRRCVFLRSIIAVLMFNSPSKAMFTYFVFVCYAQPITLKVTLQIQNYILIINRLDYCLSTRYYPKYLLFNNIKIITMQKLENTLIIRHCSR